MVLENEPNLIMKINKIRLYFTLANAVKFIKISLKAVIPPNFNFNYS